MMKYKCAMCGSVATEDPGTCCGDMREEMCENCEQVMSECECATEDEGDIDANDEE